MLSFDNLSIQESDEYEELIINIKCKKISKKILRDNIIRYNRYLNGIKVWTTELNGVIICKSHIKFYIEEYIKLSKENTKYNMELQVIYMNFIDSEILKNL
jgi:hypothetical protein